MTCPLCTNPVRIAQNGCRSAQWTAVCMTPGCPVAGRAVRGDDWREVVDNFRAVAWAGVEVTGQGEADETPDKGGGFMVRSIGRFFRSGTSKGAGVGVNKEVDREE